MQGQQLQAFFLHIFKKIVALFHSAVFALSCLPGQHINCGIRFICQFVFKHWCAGRVRHGVFADKSEHLHGLKYIILFDFLFQTVTPCGDIFIVFFFKSIHPCCGGKSKACVLKSLFNGNTVTFSYIAAAAASLDGHTAAWTIQSHLTGMDWKNTIVFQKCNSLSSCIPCQYPMFSLSVRYFRGGCSIYLKLNSRLLDIILLICSFHVLYKPFCILMIPTFWRHGIAS